MVFLQHMRAATAKLLYGHRAAQVVCRSLSTEATDAAAAALRMVRISIVQRVSLVASRFAWRAVTFSPGL